MSRHSRLKFDGIPICIKKQGNNQSAYFYTNEITSFIFKEVIKCLLTY